MHLMKYEPFGVKGTKGAHLEDLVRSCGPIVQHHHTEDVLFGFFNGHSVTVWDRPAYKIAHLEFVVHFPLRSKAVSSKS